MLLPPCPHPLSGSDPSERPGHSTSRCGIRLDPSPKLVNMPRSAAAVPFTIASLKRRRVCESVAEQIRQAIFSGQIAPGHKLPAEREMARQFQTSRVALREALRALEQEGMSGIQRA